MTKQQKVAIKCAIADLIGSMQSKNNLDFGSHDWKAHRHTIDELTDAFPELCVDYKAQISELN